MSGLSGIQLVLRSERLVLPLFHNEALQSRSAVVAFGMPYEVLLGVICYSVQNAKEAGQFFVRLSSIDQESVRTYLCHFVTRLISELDFSTTDLEAKEEFRNTPMDFPRPSPTLHFVLPAFFSEIASSLAIRDAIRRLPIQVYRR
jgi:hypothetical protein